jgi:outer membrane protein assembly factor BamA
LALPALACLGFGPVDGLAQQDDRSETSASAIDSSVAIDSTGSSGSQLIPYPVLFYSPETGVGFGAGAIWYFRRSASRLSSVSPLLFYTSKKQFSISAQFDSWFDRNRWRILADVGFSRFPAKYWGIGNDTPDEAEEDYTPRSAWARGRVEHRIVGSLYGGVRLSILARTLVETGEDGVLGEGTVPGSEPVDLVSAGLSATWDSRDDVVFPRRGMLNQLAVERYPEWLGSDYEYTSWTADLRGYLPIGAHVLAGQALLLVVDGTAPFDRLPRLGGDWLIRGYYEGRYRDNVLAALQAEARIQVWRRFGAVAFLGAGQVAPRLGGLEFGEFHPSVGLGVRYQLSRAQKLNIRVDLAVGDGSWGVYFNLGEAF